MMDLLGAEMRTMEHTARMARADAEAWKMAPPVRRARAARRPTFFRRRVGVALCVGMLALGIVAPATAVDARGKHVHCVVLDEQGFYMETGITSEYGGTLCERW